MTRPRRAGARWRILGGGIDPPFWWKPWLHLYPVVEWWYRPRAVRAPCGGGPAVVPSETAATREAG